MKSTFAEKLYMALPEEGNVFFSPLSIRAALGRAAVGARRKTRTQMLDVLGLVDVSDAELMALIAAQENFVTVPGVTIEGANRIYAEQTYPLSKVYIDLMQRFAGIQTVDFRTAFDAVRETINGWVAAQTHGRIQDLLTPGSLDDLTRMVLVNAIYFKGAWQYAFDRANTRDAAFTLASGQIVTAPMMYQQNSNFYYWRDEAMQVLAMPYQGGRLARLVLLPNAGVPLREVEQLMATRGIAAIIDSLAVQPNLEVYVPKFEMGWGTSNIKDTLIQMGIVDAFLSSDADFSGMHQEDQADLYISGVYHKAWIADKEEGSEAAAATAVVASLETCWSGSSTVFRADRPFVYTIVDTETDALLFMGRMADPSLK